MATIQVMLLLLSLQRRPTLTDPSKIEQRPLGLFFPQAPKY